LKKQKALTDLCAKIKTLPLITLIKLIFTDKEGGLVSRMIGPASVFLSGIDLVEVLPCHSLLHAIHVHQTSPQRFYQ